MTDAWYCAHEGRTAGPFTLRDLETTLAEVPGWEDLCVWREGFSEWRKAEDVEEFASLAGAVPSTARRRGVERRSAPAKGSEQNPARARSIAKTLGGIAIIAVAIVGGAFGGVISRTVYELATKSSVPTIDETPQEQAKLQEQTTLQGQATLQGRPNLREPTNVQERSTIQERIAKGLESLVTTLPKKVDDVTTMISARGEGTKVVFGYRLDVDGARLNDNVKAKVREVATRDICAEKQSREVLDLGGSFQLVYVDISGRPVTTVDIGRSSCPRG